jgi:predicted extracellular nuclease
MIRRKLSLAAVCGIAAALCVRLLALGSGGGSVSLVAIDAPYGQNFDTLSSTTTSAVLPDGWYLSESGTSSANDGKYSIGSGSGNAGDVYSFGSASGNSDRAFGTLLSGTLTPTIGAAFTNNTASAITALTISYTGEQWRLGTANRGPDRLDFQIGVTATSLDDPPAAWVDVNDLDFNSPITTGTVGAVNGNLPSNRVAVGATISGLNIPIGAAFWIRWTDFNASGADDGLAIDDFTITPHAAPVDVGRSGTGTATPAAATPGDPILLTVAVTRGTPPQPIASVTVDLAAIGGSPQPLFDDGTNGDAVANDLIYSLATNVAFGTSVGGKSLPFTITDAAARTGTGAIALNVQPPPVLTAIHDIQGAGDVSPFVNTVVTTEGIVTARRFNNGFFLQAPDAEVDADSRTSEGIFVFTSSAPPAAAAVGNRVRISGMVQEFAPASDPTSPTETEITSPTVTLLSTGNALPAAITLTATNTDPAGPIDQLEPFEGMRVHVDSLVVVAPTQGTINEAAATSSTNGVYFGVIAGVARPFREPGIEVPDPLPPGSPCCIPRFDANPERIRVDSNGQAAFGPNDTTEVMSGAMVAGITGVLDYGSRAYTILPDAGTQGVVSGLHGFTPVSVPGAHRFTIATANLERFFDTINDPNTSDVALTPAAFANRLKKASLQIRNVMQRPDIIGVEEVENLDVLMAIASQLNADSAGDVQYAAHLFEGNDPGGIDDGILVNTLRVAVRDVRQEGKDTTYINPLNGQPELLNDRPPTVLRATIVTPDDAPLDITVIANHLRSLNGVDDPTDGPRVRRKRLSQAEFLGRLIEGLQLSSGGEPIVAVGDFNAFEFSDGYVDVIGTIKGAPAAADQVVLSSTDVPNAGAPLVDLIERDTSIRRYSYSFDGNAQSLDHVVATQAAADIFAGIEWGHSNADFPETFRADSTRPERLSDHDPVVATFILPAKTTTMISASPNPAPFGQDVTFTATISSTDLTVTSGFVQFSDGAGYSASAAVSNGSATVVIPASAFGVGAHTMTAAYTDARRFAASSGSVSFSVIDVTAPVISNLINLVVEANGPSGSVVTFAPTAVDDVDGSVAVVCSPPSGTTFAIGSTTVGCTAQDRAGNIARGRFTVTVRDTTPPSTPALTVAPAVLWPPNHKLVPVTVGATATDAVSAASCALVSIDSNEPENGLGDGDTTGDIVRTGALSANLRAERSGQGAGRVYTLTVACTDAAGNRSAPAAIEVVVPVLR